MLNFLAYGLFLIVTINGSQKAPPPTVYTTEGECLAAATLAQARGESRGWKVEAQCFDLDNPTVQRYLRAEQEIRSKRN